MDENGLHRRRAKVLLPPFQKLLANGQRWAKFHGAPASPLSLWEARDRGQSDRADSNQRASLVIVTGIA